MVKRQDPATKHPSHLYHLFAHRNSPHTTSVPKYILGINTGKESTEEEGEGRWKEEKEERQKERGGSRRAGKKEGGRRKEEEEEEGEQERKARERKRRKKA